MFTTKAQPISTTRILVLKRVIIIAFTFFICLIEIVVTLGGCKKNEEANVTTAKNEEVAKVNNSVVVPDVIGMSKEDAVKALEDLGLVVKINDRFYRTNEKDNCVIAKSYNNNATLEKGTVVELQVNNLIDRWDFSRVEKDDGTLKITSFCKMGNPTGDIVVPNEIDGKRVSEISSNLIELRTWTTAEQTEYKKTTIKIAEK